MTATQTVSFKLPVADLRRIPERNRSAFFRAAVQEKLASKETVWRPRTAFGKKLAALRARHEASGAKLLTPEEVAAEVRARRGSLA